MIAEDDDLPLRPGYSDLIKCMHTEQPLEYILDVRPARSESFSVLVLALPSALRFVVVSAIVRVLLRLF